LDAILAKIVASGEGWLSASRVVAPVKASSSGESWLAGEGAAAAGRTRAEVIAELRELYEAQS
jgi:hypothetical protein